LGLKKWLNFWNFYGFMMVCWIEVTKVGAWKWFDQEIQYVDRKWFNHGKPSKKNMSLT